MKRLLSVIFCICLICIPKTVLAATKGEENALSSAESYLNFMNFSYQGLIDQLKYAGYSDEECKYAADNCGADWFDQAAGSAESYMDFMSFSKSGLIDQLVYAGYTQEEAEYGAAVAYEEKPVKPGSDNSLDTPIIDPPLEEKETVNDTDRRDTEISDASEEYIVKLEKTGDKYDLSGLSYDDLLNLKEQINLAMWSSEEWQEVEVPQGVWEIGVDIPAGKWTLTMAENGGVWCGLTLCDALDETGTDAARSSGYKWYKQLGRPGSNYNAPKQMDIELKEGLFLVIENSDVIFTPFAGKQDLGFK